MKARGARVARVADGVAPRQATRRRALDGVARASARRRRLGVAFRGGRRVASGGAGRWRGIRGEQRASRGASLALAREGRATSEVDERLADAHRRARTLARGFAGLSHHWARKCCFARSCTGDRGAWRTRRGPRGSITCTTCGRCARSGIDAPSRSPSRRRSVARPGSSGDRGRRRDRPSGRKSGSFTDDEFRVSLVVHISLASRRLRDV